MARAPRVERTLPRASRLRRFTIPAVGRLAKVKKKKKAQKAKRRAVEKARVKDKAKRKGK